MNAVAGYFSERDVNSRLVVLRTRFVDIKTGEEVDRMKKDGEYGWDRHEYWNLSDEDRERGWKTMNIDLDELIKYSIRNYGAEGFSDYASDIKNVRCIRQHISSLTTLSMRTVSLCCE